MTAPADHRTRLFPAFCLGLIGGSAAEASVDAADRVRTLEAIRETSKRTLW